jgi:hypothetical protein
MESSSEIREKIEMVRTELIEIAKQVQFDIRRKEVIEKSQELDQLLNTYSRIRFKATP